MPRTSAQATGTALAAAMVVALTGLFPTAAAVAAPRTGSTTAGSSSEVSAPALPLAQASLATPGYLINEAVAWRRSDVPAGPFDLAQLKTMAKPWTADLSEVSDLDGDGVDDDRLAQLSFAGNAVCVTLPSDASQSLIYAGTCAGRVNVDRTPLQHAARALWASQSASQSLIRSDPWEVTSLNPSDLTEALDIPGVRVTPSSVTDRDRDGFDDDGRIQLQYRAHAGGSGTSTPPRHACLRLPQPHSRLLVYGGRCSAGPRAPHHDSLPARQRAKAAATTIALLIGDTAPQRDVERGRIKTRHVRQAIRWTAEEWGRVPFSADGRAGSDGAWDRMRVSARGETYEIRIFAGGTPHHLRYHLRRLP